MKWKISLLIALVIGGLGGSLIKNLPGFVIIAYDKTSYEMRLWIAVCLLLLLITILFLLGLIFRSLLSGATKVKRWQSTRGPRKSRKRSIEGMLAFTEGRWKASEDAMIKAAKTSDTKLINYLIAAQAAQQQNAEVRRDAYLRLAYQSEPAAKTAIGLTQAQLHIQHNQDEQALASLNELKKDNPTHPFVLKLLAQLHLKLQDWSLLQELIPVLKKNHVLEAEELKQLEQKTVAGILDQQAQEGKVEGLNDTWLNFPNAYRKSKPNIIHYANLLVNFEQFNEAELLLRPIVKKQADAEVISLYGNIQSDDANKQLSFLESWQQSNKNVPNEVFLALGKLAYYAKLWGKARHFLERALQAQPSAEAYLYMARTLQQLDDSQHANTCFQQGLEFIANPKDTTSLLSLPQGSEDLVTADLLPKFQKLEHKN